MKITLETRDGWKVEVRPTEVGWGAFVSRPPSRIGPYREDVNLAALVETALQLCRRPHTCAYCKQPTHMPPYHLNQHPDGRPPSFMPSCCANLECVDKWDSKPLTEATPEELAVIQPAPPTPDTDKMTLPSGIFTASIEGVCPCGATVALSEEDPPAILHTLPQCKDFEERDALDYVRWLNEQIAARPPASA